MSRSVRSLLALILGIACFGIPAVAAPNLSCDLTAGNYIVTFKNGVDTDNELKNVHGKQIAPKFRFDKAINGFAGKLSVDEVCELKKNPKVFDVEADGTVSADEIATQSAVPSWGLDRIDQNSGLDNKYNYDLTNQGQNVTAYVIDTGIFISNSDFGGRAIKGADYISPLEPSGDCNGHGTHVAGTIGGATYGVAKKVNLVSVRVLDCNGSGSFSSVISGINWVIKNKVPGKSIANMSLGGGTSLALDSAVKNLVASGVTVVVAAGNSSRNAGNFSPSRVTEAVTVAASDKTDVLAYYSNFGSVVDVIAPGSGITSDWLNNRTATLDGTSMATPHVTGVLAMALGANLVSGPVSSLKSLPNLLSNGVVILSNTAKSAGTTSNLIFKGNL